MASKLRDIARMMGKTEAQNPDNQRLLFFGESTIDSAETEKIVETASMAVYSDLDSLPITGLVAGKHAYVSSNNRYYISNGSGWYNVATANATPYWDSEPLTTYSIEDSATPLIIIAKARDSDNADQNLLHQSTVTDSAAFLVDITRDSSVFTFTPKSQDSIGASVTAGDLTDSNTNDFIYTFKWSDGINFVSKAVTINYNFAAAILYGSVDFGAASDDSYNVNFASSYNNLGTGDFCIEGWVYRDNTGNHMFATSRATVSTVDNGDWWLDVYNGEYRVMFKESNGTLRYLHNYTNTTFASGAWIHFATVRDGSTLRAYYNGTQEASGSISTAAFSLHGSEGAMSFGGFYGSSSYAMAGHISNFRISVGDAVYPSGTTFTPPTEPLGINDDATWSVVLARDPNNVQGVLESTSGIISSFTMDANQPTASSDNPFS